MRRPYAVLCGGLMRRHKNAGICIALASNLCCELQSYAEPYAPKAGTKFVKAYAPKALHKAFFERNALCALCASWVFCVKPYARLMRFFC